MTILNPTFKNIPGMNIEKSRQLEVISINRREFNKDSMSVTTMFKSLYDKIWSPS